MTSAASTHTSTLASGWNTNADNYDAFIGKMTWPVALRAIMALDTISPFDAPDSSALDNGCGTGAVTRQLAALHPNLSILATDISEGMVCILEKICEVKQLNNVRAMVLDGMTLDAVAENTFTHTMSVAMIGTTPSPLQIARQMYRVTKMGGYAAITSNECASWRPFWTDAVRRATGIEQYEAPIMQDPTATSVSALRKTLTDAGWEVLDCYAEVAPFIFSEGITPEIFLFDLHNPIGQKLFQGLEDKLHLIRPIFMQVFNEHYPDVTTFHETAIIAMCRKARGLNT